MRKYLEKDKVIDTLTGLYENMTRKRLMEFGVQSRPLQPWAMRGFP